MIESLQEHMQANIGASITNPVIDGGWHSGRACDGKKADKISYVGHYLPKGLLVRYRHWKESGEECFTWREWGDGQGEHIDPTEYRRKREEAQAKARAAEQAATAEKVRILAVLQAVIKESVTASHDHTYITRKLITPIGARQATKRYQITPATADSKAQYIHPTDLLIPVYDHTGALQGIQQITDGGYKLMRGTFKGGLLWVGGGLTTGETPNRLYIAEGWATAVSIHMRTRCPVIVAFSTSNLLNTGHWARGRYPDSEIVYAVDNDIGSVIKIGGHSVENPGKHYATQAAIAVNAAVITPPMAEKGDWNDWHVSQIAGTKKAD